MRSKVVSPLLSSFSVITSLLISLVPFAISPVMGETQTPLVCNTQFGIFLGSHNNVVAYSNCNTTCSDCNAVECKNYVDGRYTGCKWQCVEYARRYWLENFGIYVSTTGDAWTIWSDWTTGTTISNGSSLSIDAFSNGSTTPPQEGDLLIYKSSYFPPSGHVAVITEVNTSSGYVRVAEQNHDNLHWGNNDFARELSYTSSGGQFFITTASSNIYGWKRIRASVSGTWMKSYSTNLSGCEGVMPAGGGFFAAGWTAPSGDESSDVWVIKLDASGNPTMQKTYGGSGRDDINRLSPMPDGGFAVIGLSTSFGASQHAPLILRFDSDGNLIFSRTLLSTGREWGNDVQVTSDNGYVIAGGIDIGGNNVKAAAVKLSATGAIDWQRYYCDGMLGAIRQLPGGGYIVAGRTDFTNGYDLLLMRLDDNGVDVWRKVYGGSGVDAASDLLLLPDGGYLIAGNTSSFGSGGSDVWVMKFDDAGNRIWQKVYGGTFDEAGLSIQLTDDGGIIVSAHTYSFGTNPPNVYLSKLDTDGNQLWERIYDLGTSGNGAARSVRQTIDDGYLISGGGDPSFSGGPFAVIKTQADGSISSECPAGVGDLIVSTVQATLVDPVAAPSGLGDPGFSSNVANVLTTVTAEVGYEVCGTCCIGNRGDCNNDGVDANILDLNFLVNRIFRGGPATVCTEEADINSDGTPSNILDLNFLVNRIFRGGAAPGAC